MGFVTALTDMSSTRSASRKGDHTADAKAIKKAIDGLPFDATNLPPFDGTGQDAVEWVITTANLGTVRDFLKAWRTEKDGMQELRRIVNKADDDLTAIVERVGDDLIAAARTGKPRALTADEIAEFRQATAATELYDLAVGEKVRALGTAMVVAGRVSSTSPVPPPTLARERAAQAMTDNELRCLILLSEVMSAHQRAREAAGVTDQRFRDEKAACAELSRSVQKGGRVVSDVMGDLTRGGDEPTNLRLVCTSCNARGGQRLATQRKRAARRPSPPKPQVFVA